MKVQEFKAWFETYKERKMDDLNSEVFLDIEDVLTHVEDTVIVPNYVDNTPWIERPYIVTCDGSTQDKADGINVTVRMDVAGQSLGSDWRADTSELGEG